MSTRKIQPRDRQLRQPWEKGITSRLRNATSTLTTSARRSAMSTATTLTRQSSTTKTQRHELITASSETIIDNNNLETSVDNRRIRDNSRQQMTQQQPTDIRVSSSIRWQQAVQPHKQITTGNSTTSINNRQLSNISWQQTIQHKQLTTGNSAATIDNKQLSTTNWQQAIQQQQLTTTSSAQPIDNWQFRRYFWSKSTTSWHRTRNDTVVAYIGVEFRNEGINHSKYASHCKVISAIHIALQERFVLGGHRSSH